MKTTLRELALVVAGATAVTIIMTWPQALQICNSNSPSTKPCQYGPEYAVDTTCGLDGGVLVSLTTSSSAHNGDRAVAKIAVAGHQAELGSVYLRAPSVAAQLPDQFDNMIQAPHMRLRQ